MTMATTQSPPFPILKRGYGRFRDVRRANILIVGKVSDAIKPLLGPNGMNKMLVSPTGEVVTTNHGREIMEKIERERPEIDFQNTVSLYNLIERI